MSDYHSRFRIGQKIGVGDIHAVVTGLWFDDDHTTPQVELTWIVNGDVKKAWLRERAIEFIVDGKIFGEEYG